MRMWTMFQNAFMKKEEKSQRASKYIGITWGDESDEWDGASTIDVINTVIQHILSRRAFHSKSVTDNVTLAKLREAAASESLRVETTVEEDSLAGSPLVEGRNGRTDRFGKIQYGSSRPSLKVENVTGDFDEDRRKQLCQLVHDAKVDAKETAKILLEKSGVDNDLILDNYDHREKVDDGSCNINPIFNAVDKAEEIAETT